MAVPPIPQARTAVMVKAVRVPVLLDVVVGLLTAVALPLAVVAIPNTISIVAALLPPDIPPVSMMRAHGLALPAMLLTVPLASIAVRRFRTAPVLVAGLTLLALADVAGGYAESAWLVGILRVLHGIGAGMLVPGTLAAVLERPRKNVLLPIWAGMLAASLLSAQALALWPLDKVQSWRVTLQPYPLLTGIALALAAAYLVLWLIRGDAERVAAAASADQEGADADVAASVQAGPAEDAGNRSARAERVRLARTALPSAGIAVLAIGMTFDWSPNLVVIAAALALVVMLGLVATGTFEEPGGRTLAFANVAVGLVVLPTAAQTTYLELGGVGGPGLSGIWLPFVLAAVTALLAALLAARAPLSMAFRLTNGGLAVVVAGLCAIRLLVPQPYGPPLVVPFVLLAAGAAVALVSALRLAGQGSALLGLSLCVPAVMAGFLLASGIQFLLLQEVSRSSDPSRQAVLGGFVDALHTGALAGGFVVVVVIVLASVLARRDGASGGVFSRGGAARGEQVVIPAPTPSPEGEDGATGESLTDR
ncbi:hypothetical protein GCM10023194_18650 [Planotetraspora phitsanulokensis]|uniref:Uncharacterized protein n=1 Tax=Planotetraspora phitsanulokensis TaxID=575192 RepID=A0A8J3U6H5_9ACTN|nr:hypothetical protein [Planotetraspora phitsanulokensis]GII39503.1 hypothetical protein Pph01_45060 [Planotetraspora phitsanulokensis]